ncbi:hypothetical protein [Clostridium uliginosum]|uniref:Uncharacterized protein n=1 Tax=Clostridium uliginosum TaxID=119641 RepID=A0A1I1IQR6_9CLOT|nr:hypothetical protein [Clostridium uliginosum]SFC38032.1 hypothetical protein SAMN05421842_10328 [Clostridium uliginosum]
MKNIKNYIIFLSIIILTVCLGYYFHSKYVTLDNIFSMTINKENVDKIYIRGVNSGNIKSIKDKNKINEILSNLSNVKLVEYYGDTAKNRTKGAYEIVIYKNAEDTLFIYTLGKEYLMISDNEKSLKIYKILDNSFDREYMKKITSFLSHVSIYT